MAKKLRWYGGGFELVLYEFEVENADVEIILGYNEHTELYIDSIPEKLQVEAHFGLKDEHKKPMVPFQDLTKVMPSL
jgi:hypothetical protein